MTFSRETFAVQTFFFQGPGQLSEGIFTYIYHKNQPNVAKYTSPMDPMGMDEWMVWILDS